jgi:hypothetical protein
MGLKTYTYYNEIPKLLQDYVLVVSGARNILEIDLDDINLFLSEMDQFCRKEPEHEQDGWAV